MDRVSPGQGLNRLPSDRHERRVQELELIVLEEGFRSLTVNDLAARLKCSKRTLYEIAPGKQEIVLLVMEQWLARIRHLGWQGALEHEDPAKRIAAYLKPGVSESRKASRAFLEDVRSFRPALVLLEAHQRERTAVLKDILEDGIRRQRFLPVNATLVAEFFLAAVGRVNEPRVLESARISYSAAFEELLNLLMNGVLAPSTPDGRPGKP